MIAIKSNMVYTCKYMNAKKIISLEYPTKQNTLVAKGKIAVDIL